MDLLGEIDLSKPNREEIVKCVDFYVDDFIRVVSDLLKLETMVNVDIYQNSFEFKADRFDLKSRKQPAVIYRDDDLPNCAKEIFEKFHPIQGLVFNENKELSVTVSKFKGIIIERRAPNDIDSIQKRLTRHFKDSQRIEVYFWRRSKKFVLGALIMAFGIWFSNVFFNAGGGFKLVLAIPFALLALPTITVLIILIDYISINTTHIRISKNRSDSFYERNRGSIIGSFVVSVSMIIIAAIIKMLSQ